jgi:SAM-dependent methyltransferase
MATTPPILNKTMEPADLDVPQVRRAARSLKGWMWRWTLTGGRFAVNGSVKRRAYIRRHKMWEYARGLALTSAAAGARPRGAAPLNVLDIGGAMTSTVFYLAGLGDRVLCLDVDDSLCAQTNTAARARRLPLEARTTNLAESAAAPAELGAPGGFDRIYSFCVIEHVLPPGQMALARCMGTLLRPGGQMCVTFDYGEDAPTESPLRCAADVQALISAVGLPLSGNPAFHDCGSRYALNRRHPQRRYTFGSLFFHRPL